MFASQITDTVTIGEIVVTIAKLNDRKLREAAEIAFDRSVALQKKLSSALPAPTVPPESDEEQQKKKPPKPEPTLDEKREARYNAYDRDTVLRAGVKGWTGEKKFSQSAIDDLDYGASKQLHEAICDLSLPALEDGAEEAA